MAQDPETLAARAGTSSNERGAPSAPDISLASTFASAGDPAGAAFPYLRLGNPTWEALESGLGALEDADALAFASGQAAALALLLALTHDRSRVLLPPDGYYGMRKLAHALEGRGVEAVVVDLAHADAVEAALARGPAVIWAESPTNPFLRVFDLAELGDLARAFDAHLVVDNTTATGASQRPLEYGACASFYSLSKSISGHADVVLGAVVARDAELLARVRDWRTQGGGIPGVFESWLALRGLRTLPLRLARQSENALAVARHLQGDARVARVHHPELDPLTADLARRQMPRGSGPLVSFEVAGGAAAAERVVAAGVGIRASTSFGGVESSWERRARWPSESAPVGLIRLSCGIEATDDLLGDVTRALEGATRPS
jgi:cystathionine beta-lyase/cystathionine gamma-synthase